MKSWQRRWRFIGDAIQRNILLAERHYEKFTGEDPCFRIERTKDGFPAFEDLVKTRKIIEHNGQRFSLIGMCNGILEYTEEHGVVTRVGLEIKLKQTSYVTQIKRDLIRLEEHTEENHCNILTFSQMAKSARSDASKAIGGVNTLDE